jgi:putative FmdB family regulatory protein
MPLYEYECRGCGHRFEILVFGKIRPVCPNCQGEDLEKAFSTFATSSTDGYTTGNSCAMRTPSGGCGSTGGG